MNVPIDNDLRLIARSIIAEKRSLDSWAEVESDDMFQEGSFVGGFDANEMEFCFSYDGLDGELWFQLSLSQIEQLASGATVPIVGRRPT